MRKVTTVVVAAVVAASCVPWLRHRPFFPVLVAITVVALAVFIMFGGVRALSTWSKQERQQGDSTRSGWWSPGVRNLSLGAAFVLVLMLTVPHFMATRSDAYELAMATARQAPQFTDALGAPVREAWFSEGTTEYGSPTKAQLTIPVKGPRRTGSLRVLAMKEDGRWKLRALTLELEQSGERIDLLANSK